jgi:hypothetical protein
VTGWLYHWVYLDFYAPVWPNIIASILVAAWVTLRLRAGRRLQEQIRDLHERHHAEHMAALSLDTPGGLAAVMSEVRDAKTAAESAHGAVQALGVAVKPRPARRGATEMHKTGDGKADGGGRA